MSIASEKLRKFAPFVLPVVATLGVVVVSIHPVASLRSRVTLIVCVLTLLVLAAHRLRRRPRLRFLVPGLTAIAAVATLAPIRASMDAGEEGRAAAKAALAYEGVGYVWGGESARGIDCSGLVRRAYIDAALHTAFTRGSPAHLRRAMHWWWSDTTAREFETAPPVSGERIGVLPNLRGNMPDTLRPGDLAIVTSGAHVLLYLGEHRWIQADPSAHRVNISDSRSDRNTWLDGSAVLLRPRL